MALEKTTRREFLVQTCKVTLSAGLGLGLPTVITSQALGGRGIAPASERIRLGCIGVGNRGKDNLRTFMKHVVAVCDVDKVHLAEAKALVEKTNGGICAAYGDYRKLLEDKTLDGVVVTTPDHWHALITIHACQAGKDVYCEKPLSLTIA